jgi:hypothetical protein
MEPEGPLSCSQVPSTGPDPESDQPSPHHRCTTESKSLVQLFQDKYMKTAVLHIVAGLCQAIRWQQTPIYSFTASLHLQLQNILAQSLKVQFCTFLQVQSGCTVTAWTRIVLNLFTHAVHYKMSLWTHVIFPNQFCWLLLHFLKYIYETFLTYYARIQLKNILDNSW